MDGYPVRSSEPETVKVPIRILGTGAANPTKVYGKGVTITRTGAGAYLATFSGKAGELGNYVGMTVGLEATTPGDMAGHTVVAGATATSAAGVVTKAFVLYNATFAARDLAALEWITIEFAFKQAGAAV